MIELRSEHDGIKSKPLIGAGVESHLENESLMNRCPQPMLAASAIAFLLGATSVCSAIDFLFVHEGFSEGAFVVGSFSGDDLDNNGQISSFNGEITAFEATFSGNSIIPAFEADLSNLFGLVYDPAAGPVIGDGIELAVEGIGVNTLDFSYTTGQGPGPFPGGEITDSTTGAEDLSDLNAIVTRIPEPSSGIVALLTGFFSAGRRRVRR